MDAIEAKRLPPSEWLEAYVAIVNRLAPPASQPADGVVKSTIAHSQPASGGGVGLARSSVVTIEADDRLGSGFCVHSPQTIVTAAHVIEKAGSILVETADGERLSAVVLTSDASSDLAVLMVNRSGGLRPLAMRTAAPEIGEECFAMGSPKGLSGTVTKGIVSAVRTINGVQLVQTDAAINRGNSGGPLIDREGRVLGVCDFKFTGDAEGLAFAVGPDAVRAILGLTATAMPGPQGAKAPAGSP